MPYAIACFFCGQMHSSDYWDDIDASLERCRQRASAKDRGELDQWADDTMPARCEASIPPDVLIVEQERAA